jgi:PleD family two-component response regulator
MRRTRVVPVHSPAGESPGFPPGLHGGASVARRILVVDDEPMVRALISRVLTDDGFEVVAGLSGPELIARVRQDFPFSVAALRAAVRGLLAR